MVRFSVGDCEWRLWQSFAKIDKKRREWTEFGVENFHEE